MINITLGQTSNLADRLLRHNNGYEKFTSRYLPWSLGCSIPKATRGEALILEAKLKNLNRDKLLKFIEKYS